MTNLRLIKSIGRSPSRLALLLIPLVFVCFALPQSAQAVYPPPDGGYQGGNTAEGQNALQGTFMGTYNTAVGCFSLYGNTTGHFNTGVGAGALFLNIGNENTAVGVLALFGNTIGVDNTAIGPFALQSNTTGNFTVALGNNALTGLTTGSNNIALGTDAGVGVSTGNSNIDIGNFGGGESATIRIGDPTIHAATFIAGISGTAVTGAPVVINGNGQLGVAPSSKRFKTDTKPMDKASETIFALKPVTFCYKKEIDPQS